MRCAPCCLVPAADVCVCVAACGVATCALHADADEALPQSVDRVGGVMMLCGTAMCTASWWLGDVRAALGGLLVGIAVLFVAHMVRFDAAASTRQQSLWRLAQLAFEVFGLVYIGLPFSIASLIPRAHPMGFVSKREGAARAVLMCSLAGGWCAGLATLC